MTLVLASLAALALGSVIPAALWRRPRLALRVALAGAWTAAALGLIPALAATFGGPGRWLTSTWRAPLGSFTIGLDALSGFFLVPIMAVTALGALAGHRTLMARSGEHRAVTAACLSNALTASMVLLVLARDSVLFLVAWEVMALASYFLITFEDQEPEVQTAGFVTLVATHLGTACLLVFFVMLRLETGSYLFPPAGAVAAHPLRHLLFALAVAGFGTKAGIAPLHVWLPRAHPAAPSHVSAVMSGVMIKTGIYGLLRALAFLDPPAAAWGYVLLGLGALSAVGGVLFALAQRDLKRMLAYSSVENIGIICLGIGAGLLGRARGDGLVEMLGFAGALLHVWNHAAFKSLLFLAAGAAAHAAHERDLDRLGGLLSRMPVTGLLFLVGSVAISGLPPLNGFASEWLIFWSFLAAGGHLTGWAAFVCVMGAVALALVGSLALACFARAFGIAFLGEPRNATPGAAHDPERTGRLAMIALALTCTILGVFPAQALHACRAAAQVLSPAAASQAAGFTAVGEAASRIGVGAIALLALAVLVFAARTLLLRPRSVAHHATWGCGYRWPSPRMQYSGSSFAQPLLELFRGVLVPTVRGEAVQGTFPRRASLTAHTEDPAEQRLFGPAFASLPEFLGRFRWMQAVPVQVQLLYILIGLVALMVLGLIGTAWTR